MHAITFLSKYFVVEDHESKINGNTTKLYKCSTTLLIGYFSVKKY